jgi:hypothetical protein
MPHSLNEDGLTASSTQVDVLLEQKDAALLITARNKLDSCDGATKNCGRRGRKFDTSRTTVMLPAAQL